jgi:hypothetical protein
MKCSISGCEEEALNECCNGHQMCAKHTSPIKCAQLGKPLCDDCAADIHYHPSPKMVEWEDGKPVPDHSAVVSELEGRRRITR